MGRAFEPDFVLFCKQKEGENLIYQVFIDPKDKYLKEHDKWKEGFLKKTGEDKKRVKISADKYLITGVPFYNNENENKFEASLQLAIA